MARTLAEQRQRQVRFHLKQGAWLGCVFVVGFGFSSMGLIAARGLDQDGLGLSPAKLGLLWFGFLYFGLGVSFWLLRPFWLRPRIVPYFARQIEEYGGETSAAFWRGRGLYREIVALDELANSLGVRPLSAFGFADDYYGQQVHWHAASEGARTVEGLRQGPALQVRAVPHVTGDLEALASVLSAAAQRGVDFSLALRLHKDSVQVVASMEMARRQGSFW